MAIVHMDLWSRWTKNDADGAVSVEKQLKQMCYLQAEQRHFEPLQDWISPEMVQKAVP